MPPPHADSLLAERLAWATKIARDAGEITLQYFRSPRLEVEQKEDHSPVTIADREAEKFLRQQISERFPGDGIVGEELGETLGDSGFTWILDPIDGTKSFIHGIPLYTTLVAVLETPDGNPRKGIPRIGVIRAPALDEMVFARTGHGAWHQRGEAEPTPARVGTTSRLAEALLVTSEVASFRKHRTPDATDVFLALQHEAKLARTWGDGYGYLMVATGRADVMIDPAMNLWDAAALEPILTEAGGTFSDWQGNPTVHSGEAIATNRTLIDQILTHTQNR